MPGLADSNLPEALRLQVKEKYELVRAHPSDATINGNLAMLFHAWQQYESAGVYYGRAHIIQPREFKWAYYLGTVQVAAGKNTEAVTTLRHALKLSPTSIPARMKLGEALTGLGNFAEAETLYSAIVTERSDFAPGWYWLGRVLSAKGDSAGAIEKYEQACRIAPAYGAAHYALSLALQKTGETNQARDHMTLYQRNQLIEPSSGDDLLNAIDLLNGSALSHLRRGANLGAEGQIQQAIDEHLKALELSPQLAQAHVNLISLYGRMGDVRAASEHYKAAVSLDASIAQSYYDFGVLMFERKEYAKAEAAFRKTLDIDPHNPEAHNNLAFLLEQQGQSDEAMRHYRAALEMKPDYRLAHFHLGRLLLAKGHDKESIVEFQQTLTPQDENTSQYLFALAAAYARSGDRPDALKYGHEAEEKARSLGQTQLQAVIQKDLQKLEATAVR